MQHKFICTVLMDPSVCSTADPASAYAFRPRLDNLDSKKYMIPKAMTIGGKLANMTRDKSQPLVNAIIKLPIKVETSCTKLAA